MNRFDSLIKVGCVVFAALMLESCTVCGSKVNHSPLEERKQDEKRISETAFTQTEKLRNHFLGYGSVDVSTLIAETSALSTELKKTGRHDEANKLDSYIDVLMFGNNTIDESIDDVMELIGNR